MPNDPFRVLGLGSHATTAEIKRAYRALAKANHPDSAGESALPRFLAIQAAYEQLVASKARGAGRSRAGPSRTEPWRADPARAPRGAGTTGGSAGGGTTRRRSTKKATFGSTTYDEAHDPADPTWQGAAWYGPSSGEYWTVNPREYADPRKHGPEYQARAADRAARARVRHNEAEAAERRADDARTAGPPAPEARAAEAERVRAAHVRRAAETSEADAAARADAPAVQGAPSIAWLDGSRLERSPFRRYVLALVAWPPLGIAAASVIGQATGCAEFSASCTSQDALLPWFVQAVILVMLAAVPFIARLLVGGTAAVLALALPAAAALSAGGAAYDRAHGPASLMAVLGLGWIAGVALMVLRTFRTRSTA